MRKKYDYILYSVLACLLAVSAAAALLPGGGSLAVEVVRDGKTLMTRSLSSIRDGQEFEFRSDAGFNIISARDGTIKMISADCPGGDCVRMRGIGSGGGTIVCVPHGLLVRVVSGNETIDSLSY
jgi:hypothetical protein